MRILVVDDDPLMRDFLAETLRTHHYAVDTSSEGEEGLYKAENNDYDAIVLDMIMPGISGSEVLKQLRKTKKTPVLMLTAQKEITAKVSTFDTGADDYLVKPFEPLELLARLRALIRRTTQHAHSCIEIGEIEIDFAARVVKRAGQYVELGPREYAIVEHLAMHRGEIVTRTALYEHVFDENDDSLSNVIDVHIGKLRKKLGRDFITTHHGQGYSVGL
ncbi:MAG: response regulator transcription factor [Verrucomicrobiota bacterium]|jgi:two-component system, OmpR family, response regulator